MIYLIKENSILESIKNIICQQVNLKLSEIKTVKSISGVAKSTENSNNKVNVQLVGETQELSFPNKSGEFISVGDTVVIEYWKDLTKGYISRRIGAYKANGRLSVTQAEFDSMQTAGKLIEGWVYDIIG